MKNTPAVFLTSLAVSAISLTIPLPAATTVLNLFIGEDLTVQEMAHAKGEISRHATHEIDGADAKPASTDNNRHEKVTHTGGTPLTDDSGDTKRILPNVLLKYLARVNDLTQRPDLKDSVYGHLTRPLYMNKKAAAYSLIAKEWLRIKLPDMAFPSVMVQRVSERCLGAGAREIQLILRR